MEVTLIPFEQTLFSEILPTRVKPYFSNFNERWGFGAEAPKPRRSCMRRSTCQATALKLLAQSSRVRTTVLYIVTVRRRPSPPICTPTERR